MTASVKPLFEDASAPEALRELVALARADGPSEADLQRLAALIMLAEGAAQISAPKQVELGSPPPDIAVPGGAMLPELRTPPVGRLLGSTLTKKLMAALGLTAAIGLGWWGAPHGPVRPAVPRAQATLQTALPSTPVSLERSAAPAETRGAEPLPEAIDGAAGGSKEDEPAAEPGGSSRIQVSVPRSARRPSVRSRASELELITRAEAARADVAQALSLLELHQRLYPDGALAQEREALAIDVLVRAGEGERARMRARRFTAAYPQSAHEPRVRALIARIGGK